MLPMGTARGTVAILGGGRMGEAILQGLLRGGRSADALLVVEKDAARAASLAEQYGVGTPDAGTAVAGAGVVVLAVKPQDLVAVLDDVAPAWPAGTLAVSIAAGIPAATIEAHLPAGVPVVRVMPNTPALVGEGMSVLCAGTSASDDDLAEAEDLLRPLGDVLRLPESQIDAVTAVSGSGPAYVFYLAEAMIDAGVELGLDRDVAARLATQTVAGAGILLRSSGQPPEQLRAAVTSKGGTTAAAVATLDEQRVREAVAAALTAARDRSVELAKG